VKLAKSLIITGLLFSSVLGRVNVGSITAMAATGQASGQVPGQGKTITIEYVDADGAKIEDAEFLESAKPTVDVSTDKNVVLVNTIKLPENYALVTAATPDTTATINDSKITLKVKNVVKESVKISCVDVNGGPMAAPVEKIKLIDQTKQVKGSNLNIPDGFKFVEYIGGVVHLQQVIIANVNITLVDENNHVVKNVTINDRDISQKITEHNVTVPNGYTAVNNQSVSVESKAAGEATTYSAKIKIKKNTPAKKPSKTGRITQQVQVSFFDQNGDEVGYQLLKGKERDTTKIEAPKGYSFIKASDATIKFDKSGAKKLKLNVKRNTSTPVMEKGVITTNGGSFKRLYTIDGKVVTNRGLSTGSKWFTDQYATINGEKMLRVATNEWVKASDIH